MKHQNLKDLSKEKKNGKPEWEEHAHFEVLQFLHPMLSWERVSD